MTANVVSAGKRRLFARLMVLGLLTVLVSGATGALPRPPASAAPSVKYYEVRNSFKGKPEFLFEIAERFLGDGHRFREIFDLNKGRLQPDGRRLVKDTEIEPRWLLVLPNDARGDGVKFGPLPCCAEPAPPPKKTAPSTTAPKTTAPDNAGPDKTAPTQQPALVPAAPQQNPERPAGPPPQRCTPPSTELVRDQPWAQKRLALQRAWQLSLGKGVIVGVVDSGVDGKVPQLAGRVRPGQDVVTGANGGNADDDCLGHGTMVAGIIAAAELDGTGFAGVAPEATILPIRQANGNDDGTASSMARGIRAAVDAGAKVINISASSFFPSEDLRSAVEYAAGKDVLIVAAASNEAQEGNPKAYPAAYPQVLAVGAIGEDGKRTDFSEVGYYLDMVAPGKDVIGLSRGGPGHVQDSGTSFAAPFVAGVAALVRSYHPGLTAEQVKKRIELTADHPGRDVPDVEFGNGVVNPFAAVSTAIPGEQAGGGKPGPGQAVSGESAGSTDSVTGRVSNRVNVPEVPAENDYPRSAALVFSGFAVLAVVVLGLLAVVIPRGHRRRWQPSGSTVTAGSAGAAGSAVGARVSAEDAPEDTPEDGAEDDSAPETNPRTDSCAGPRADPADSARPSQADPAADSARLFQEAQP